VKERPEDCDGLERILDDVLDIGDSVITKRIQNVGLAEPAIEIAETRREARFRRAKTTLSFADAPRESDAAAPIAFVARYCLHFVAKSQVSVCWAAVSSSSLDEQPISKLVHATSGAPATTEYWLGRHRWR